MNTSAAVVPFYFQNNEVRTVKIDNDPWFVAKDAANVLEIAWKGSETVAFLDDDEKGVRKFRTPGGEQELVIISESGLYSLIIRSNKPQAKPFRKWVTAEVLPSIRKTGGYRVPGKRARVLHLDHTYRKDSTAPGGLDIRYQLDLTKVLLNPRRVGVELLERLTGIQLSDVLPEVASGDDILSEFIEARLIRSEEDSRVPLGEMYRHFINWHFAAGHGRSHHHRKWLSAGLREAGFTVEKRGGIFFVYGASCREVIA